jgi:hypothetical protein
LPSWSTCALWRALSCQQQAPDRRAPFCRAVCRLCGPLVQSCAGEELLHDVQATDVPLVDSSVPAGGGLVKDAIGPLLSRHNCFARSAAPSHGCADGTAWWWANRQLLQSAAGTQRLPPVLGGTRIGDCVA